MYQLTLNGMSAKIVGVTAEMLIKSQVSVNRGVNGVSVEGWFRGIDKHMTVDAFGSHDPQNSWCVHSQYCLTG